MMTALEEVAAWGTITGNGCLIIGLPMLWLQLRRMRQERESAEVVAVNDRVMSHNYHVLDHDDRCAIVQQLEGLHVEPNNKEKYWAARAVHLGHMNLLWQVWELSGRPGPGRGLQAHFLGWQRFAVLVVRNPLRNSYTRVQAHPDQATPEDLAASDYWRGLQSYEVVPPRLFAWLSNLPEIE